MRKVMKGKTLPLQLNEVSGILDTSSHDLTIKRFVCEIVWIIIFDKTKTMKTKVRKTQGKKIYEQLWREMELLSLNSSNLKIDAK